MTQACVVVGVDGSETANTAIRWAAVEAAARGARLKLVHAFVWPLFHVPLGPTEAAPGLRATADHIAQEAVELAQKAEPGLPVESAVVDGFPSPVLTAESRHADLVVIGSRGSGGALSLLVGSTGIDLAAYAHSPVVVVRPGQLGESGTRVVIGYDSSTASAAALDFGLEYAHRHNLAVRVVAVQPAHTEHDRVTRRELAEAVGTNEVEAMQVAGHPAEQLLRLSADARLIVVGSRGRGGFKGLLLGSVSQAVLHHADCPVAVIPAGAMTS